MRLTELLLFLTPFALALLWRLTASVGGPPRAVLIAGAASLALLACALAWFSEHNALPPHASYVPAQLQNGRIVPGHAGTPDTHPGTP